MYEILIERYKKTGWHIFLVPTLIVEGVFDKDEANRLFKSGHITISQGMNGRLIVLNIDKINIYEI